MMNTRHYNNSNKLNNITLYALVVITENYSRLKENSSTQYRKNLWHENRIQKTVRIMFESRIDVPGMDKAG